MTVGTEITLETRKANRIKVTKKKELDRLCFKEPIKKTLQIPVIVTDRTYFVVVLFPEQHLQPTNICFYSDALLSLPGLVSVPGLWLIAFPPIGMRSIWDFQVPGWKCQLGRPMKSDFWLGKSESSPTLTSKSKMFFFCTSTVASWDPFPQVWQKSTTVSNGSHIRRCDVLIWRQWGLIRSSESCDNTVYCLLFISYGVCMCKIARIAFLSTGIAVSTLADLARIRIAHCWICFSDFLY